MARPNRRRATTPAAAKPQVQTEEVPTRRVRVVATRLGFYGHKRRHPGDEFIVTLREGEKPGTWWLPKEEYLAQQRAREEEAAGEADNDDAPGDGTVI
jgi:hypothetical protein